jgi:tetratricopeptide (TPR) repeat protein
VRRFLVGDPQVRVFEVLAGSLLDKVDRAESLARRGEVVISAETAVALGNEAVIVEQRPAKDGSSVAVLGNLNRISDPQPWPQTPLLSKEQARPWLHPFIFEYINSGQEMFMAQLRPSVALFMHFSGIDYENDPDAGLKFDVFFRWVQERVEHYGGTLIDITTGDKGSYFYIAVGTPYAHEDDAARAVALGQSLLALPSELDFIYNVRLGITRGTIWSGSIGRQDWRTFAAIGNEVNLAARLMEAADPAHMLVSERIAEATRNNFHWQLLREISVKGISKPVKVFEAIPSQAPSHASRLSSYANMVGRKTERMLLNEILHNTDANSSRVVVIEGEAGIGKSRLISDLLLRAQTEDIPALIGAGYAIEQSTGYHVWRPIFETLFGLDASDDGEGRRAKALDWISEHDTDLLERVPLLAPVLSLDAQDNSLTEQMTGQVRAENTRILLISILKAYIGNSPLVLVLEDAHWFDSSSFALTVDAIRSLSNVMIVISTRPSIGDVPEQLSAILDLAETLHIKLGQMDQNEITSLVCQQLGVKSLPRQVVDLILSKAEGHPFFSEELAYSLREVGVITVNNDECRISPDTDLHALNFPDTVQGVIRSRIDRLAPSHQLALKAASVVGRVFALRAVHEIYPLASEKPQVGTYFEYLRRLDFTPLNSEMPDLTYLFKHVITQEVAYNLMTFSQRQTFHQAVAGWYEQTFAEDLSPYYGVLAYHWSNAKDPQKTIEYLEKAGEQAMLNFANREAIDFFEEALRLAQGNQVKASALQRAHWERQLAEAHYGLGELPKSLEHLKSAIHIMGWKTPEKGFGLVTALLREVFKQVRFRMKPRPIENTQLPNYLDDTHQAKLLEGSIAFVRLGHIYYQMNQPIRLIFGNVQGINLAEKSALKSPILVRCYTNMCIASGVLPRHDWAIAYRNRAHAMGRDVNDLPALSYSLAGGAVYEIGAALWDDVSKSLNEAIEIDAHLGDMRHFDEGTSLLAIARFHQGEFKYGVETAAAVLERASQRKDVIAQVWSYTMNAEIILRQSKRGTLHQAIAEYEEVLKLLEKNIDLASEIRASGALALAYWRSGEPLRALDLATATAKKTVGNPTAPYAIEGYAGVAEVFLTAWQNGESKYRLAAQQACKALKKFAGVFPLGQPRLQLYQGWFESLDGKPEQARLHWDGALAEAESLRMPYEQGRALLYLGQHILHGEEKAKALTRALEIFNQLGVQYEAEKVNTLIA